MKKLMLLTLLFAACTTNKKVSLLQPMTPLAPSVEVKVFGMGQKIPEGLTLLGSLKIGDGGMTQRKNCTYDKVIADAQAQARSMGGNVIQLTQIKDPDLISTCYRIRCDVYFEKK